MDSESSQSKPTYDHLYHENLLLRQELEDARAENQNVWKMLFETNRRLQLSSAAIKASVSSLLNYDIFWGGTNQHEFLVTINNSIDQVGQLINIHTIIFRLKAGTLELKRSYQALPEVFLVVQEHLSKRMGNLALEMSVPPEGKLVFVNYDYLVIALEFLIEVASQYGAKKITIGAVEAPMGWMIDIGGLAGASMQGIQELLKDQEAHAMPDNALGPDDQLRLWLAIHLLLQQGIQLEIADSGTELSHLHLLIPTQTGE